MIPKVIHYIWIGGKPEPKILKKCKKSWKKFCPDYEIKRWDETNLDLEKFKFAKDAYESKKWAFASDVFRFDILANEGGIYLDTDVELLKNLDDLLNLKCFTGFEDEKFVAPGLIFGAEKGSKICEDMLKIYNGTTFDVNNIDNITICRLMTDYLVKNYGLKQNGEIQELKELIVFSPEYFCPKNNDTLETAITQNTVSIHHYSATWVKKTLKDGLKSLLRFVVGNKNYQKLKKRHRENKEKKS